MEKKICFPNLRAEMARRKLTISGMAKELEMNRDTLARQLAGPISVCKAMVIKEMFFPECDLEYLFKKD